jgi:hypothetical protein
VDCISLSIPPAHVCRYDWHSPAFAIAFHFCFLLVGYAYRGLDAANVMFLKFAALTLAGMSLALGGLALRVLLLALQEGAGVWLSAEGALCLLAPLLVWTCVRLMTVAQAVQGHPGAFPQSTHSMV